MPREIKFRGKRIDNGEWVYGYYFYDENRKRHFIFNLSITGVLQENKVDPETVGQYIGKKDKNKKEIYEGDIIEDGLGRKFPIVWNNEYSQFDIEPSNIGLSFPEIHEVIGNIHENPLTPKTHV